MPAVREEVSAWGMPLRQAGDGTRRKRARIAACRLRTGNSLGNRPAKRPLRKGETKAMRRPVGTLRVPGVERPEPEAAEGRSKDRIYTIDRAILRPPVFQFV